VDEVEKKQQHDGGKVKVLRPQELTGELPGQVEGVSINLSESEEAIGAGSVWTGGDERLNISGRMRCRGSVGNDG
jgi:hypothetical protein